MQECDEDNDEVFDECDEFEELEAVPPGNRLLLGECTVTKDSEFEPVTGTQVGGVVIVEVITVTVDAAVFISVSCVVKNIYLVDAVFSL